MTELRVYLIGAGAIARTHANAIAKLPNPEQVTLLLADPNPAVLADFGQKYPQARLFDNARTMLAEPARPDDVVVVATPPVAHLEMSLAGLRSGRHVLCEKPLAMNMAEANEMLAAARAAGKLLGCCSTRFSGVAATEGVKRLLRDGALGPIYHLSFIHRAQRSRPGVEYQPSSRWFLDKSRSGGGPIIDWGPYDSTTLNDLLDPVRIDVLAAWTANPETAVDLPPGAVFDVEEHAGASLLYHLADGSRVRVTYERAACTHSGERSAAEVEGLRGAAAWDWLSWSGKGDLTVTRDREGKPEREVSTLVDESGLKFWNRPLVYFVRRTQGQPAPALVDEQAVFNFSCLMAIYACAATGEVQTLKRR